MWQRAQSMVAALRCETSQPTNHPSSLQCRLIVSQMSSTRCELFNWLLLPLTLSTLSAILCNLSHYELLLLRANGLLYTLLHLHYGVCVVRQMCDHFNINCFSLAKREPKSPELENLGKRM